MDGWSARGGGPSKPLPSSAPRLPRARAEAKKAAAASGAGREAPSRAPSRAPGKLGGGASAPTSPTDTGADKIIAKPLADKSIAKPPAVTCVAVCGGGSGFMGWLSQGHSHCRASVCGVCSLALLVLLSGEFTCSFSTLTHLFTGSRRMLWRPTVCKDSAFPYTPPVPMCIPHARDVTASYLSVRSVNDVVRVPEALRLSAHGRIRPPSGR